MKRLMKVMVATVTSICMLAINLPMTAVNVHADSEPVYVLSYTHDNTPGNNEPDTPALTQDNTPIANDSFMARGTINISIPQTIGGSINEVRICDGYGTLISSFRADDQNNGVGSYTMTGNAVLRDMGVGHDEQNTYIELRLQEVYKVTLKASIYRRVDFFAENDNRTLEVVYGDSFNGHTCEGMMRDNIYTSTYTFYLSERPATMQITNPGGVAAEYLLRLVNVNINNVDQPVLNRYDRCEYSVSPDENNELRIELRGDGRQGYVIEWCNTGGNNSNTNISDEEVFQHGSARIVGIFAGESVDSLQDVSSNYDLTNGCIDFEKEGFGTIRLESGYWVAFEFTPDPGYQLWTFQDKDNAVEISSSGNTNTYLFQVPDNNVHFFAEFRSAEDFVNVEDGTMITGGDVVLNDFDINGGSARVNVQPQDPSIYANDEAIEAICEDNELEVQDYLNIDLDQVYHIANTDNGYWTTNSFHDLGNGYAEITLQMADDFRPGTDSICLIHDRGEGAEDRYETINAQYDQETNTITFRTNGFSNYLIAAAPNGSINNENPDDERPHYLIENTNEGIGLYTFEYHEDIDEVLQVPCEPGFFVQDDAIIDMSEYVPGDVTIKMNIDGEVIDYDPGFCPEHWVIFDGVTVDGNTYTFNFSLCWNVTVGAVADASIAVYGENGLLTPIGECRDNPVSVNIDENEDEPYAMAELFFDTEPSYIEITGNDYMMMYILGVEDEDLSPLGTTTVNYPEDNRGFMWLEIGGIQRNEEDTYIFDTEGIAGATYTINGSASGDHAIVIQSFASSAIPASVSSAMSSLIEDSEYSNAVFLYGFDIYLVDGNGIVTDPGYSVTITIRLEEAIALEDGQSLFLVHMHGDGANATYELIEVVYDATNKTITFTTSSFSPFVLNKGTKTDPVTPAATPANEETPAAQATTTEAAPAAAAATTTQAAAQAARTGEAQSYNGTVGIILILSAAALVFYVWRKETELEWFE